MTKDLHVIVKDIFSDFGIELVRSSRMLNYLSDYLAFEKVPASKAVVKTVLLNGYGERLYRNHLSAVPHDLFLLSTTQEISTRFGYKEELVKYVLDCFAYGLGWKNYVAPYIDTIVRSHSTSNNSYLYAQLSSLKKDYIDSLNKLITKPAGVIIKKSGYYTQSAESKLSLIEDEIKNVSSTLGINNNSWCGKEKSKVLSFYRVSTFSNLRRFTVFILLPLVVLSTFGNYYYSYLDSRSKIEDYDALIAEGDKLYSEKQFDKAISFYQSASNYSGSYKSNDYVDKANEKIRRSCLSQYEQEMEMVNDYISNGDYLEAKRLLEKDHVYSQYLNYSQEKRIERQLSSIETKIQEEISSGKDEIINIISGGNGSLSNEGKKKLSRLRKLQPNDYWLNLIYNKTK